MPLNTRDASQRHRAEPSLLPKLEPSPVSVMLTPPSPICSPTSTLTHLGLKALYVVLVLIWPTDHSELKFTAGNGELQLRKAWALLG